LTCRRKPFLPYLRLRTKMSRENIDKFKKFALNAILDLLAALLIVIFILQAFRIPSGSMEPLLKAGDRILVFKPVYGFRLPFTGKKVLRFFSPKRGKPVVFRFPKDETQFFIKRCLGLPGDILELKAGKLLVNGLEITEPYAAHYSAGSKTSRMDFGPYKVPEGRWFMLGDNRDSSFDSRYWGPVGEEDLTGTPLCVYWPLERLRIIK